MPRMRIAGPSVHEQLEVRSRFEQVNTFPLESFRDRAGILRLVSFRKYIFPAVHRSGEAGATAGPALSETDLRS
jgi:hypothetical protein